MIKFNGNYKLNLILELNNFCFIDGDFDFKNYNVWILVFVFNMEGFILVIKIVINCMFGYNLSVCNV